MDEHTIRLRGGWECIAIDRGDAGPARLNLPAAGGSLPTGRLRLVRRFQRPPRAAGARSSCGCDRSSGILSLALNGHPIGPASPDRPKFEVNLPPLAPRNELVVEAEPPRGAADWGVFCLVFGGGGNDGAGTGAADA